MMSFQNPFAPQWMDNPYPVYKEMRAGPPQRGHLGFWMISRHSDVVETLRNSKQWLSENLGVQIVKRHDSGSSSELPYLWHLLGHSPFYSAGADHLRIRELASRIMSQVSVETLRQQVFQRSRDLWSSATSKGTFDAVTDFALPLSVSVLRQLMGFDIALEPSIYRWSMTLSRAFEMVLPKKIMHEMNTATHEAVDAIREVMKQSRKDTLVSSLSEPDHSGKTLSEEQVLGTALSVLAAGMESTAAGMENALNALLENPEQWAWLKTHREQTKNAVEEFLRFDSPIQVIPRTAAMDAQLGGSSIAAGSRLLIMLGAANRDETVFDAAEQLRLNRPASKSNLAFGYAGHYCLGAALARLEMEAMLSAVLDGPAFTFGNSPKKRLDSITSRAFLTLPLRVTGTP